MTSPLSRVWAEVSPAALRHNAEFARAHTERPLIAVVKANAYGHGTGVVVPALRDLVRFFAVANVEEAAAVRTLAPDREIMLLSPCLPFERPIAVADGFIASVSSVEEAQAFGPGARVTLKVDTGMGRIGVWHEEALSAVEALAADPGITLHGIATHLPSPDEDADFTRAQLATFAELIARIRRVAPAIHVHAVNSGGLLGFPDGSFDLVRAGLMLYGSAPLPEFQSELLPALTWKTRVLLVRDLPAGRSLSYGRTFITPHPMRVATLGVGYADGYPRQASNRGAHVWIAGHRCPLLGRVTMDQILVDVSALPAIQVGDEAELVGEHILAAELAGWGGTIAWDIFTGIGGRTRRVVTDRDSTAAGAGCG